MRQSDAGERPYIARLLSDKRVVVCCGAGGVGKTTTAAALGLAGATLGKRTLVLTIDPARRLAEAIGSPQTARAPVPVADTRLEAAGISGSLATWMVDPRVVFERMVRRLTTDEAQAESILANRIYRALADLVAGMQEYTAAEALYGFVESGEYDLVVLDTPPSRNALDFLEAPRKLSLFLDERIIGVFLPGSGGGGGIFRSRARQVAHGVFGRIFGEGFFEELQQFLAAFSGMFTAMRSHAESVRTLLKSDASSFVVIASPEPAALAEAAHLERTLTGEMQLPFSGFILNRSWAYTRGLTSPSELVLPKGATSVDHAALAKLEQLAAEELRLAERDRRLLASLRHPGAEAVATPQLDGDIDFAALLLIAESLVAPARGEDALEIQRSR